MNIGKVLPVNSEVLVDYIESPVYVLNIEYILTVFPTTFKR